MADWDDRSADLGPLAWVKGELSKSLDLAVKALRRFATEAENAIGSDLSSSDTSQLRVARTHIHQALGAMEMVGWDKAASLLRSMEQLVNGFIPKPQACTPKAVSSLESAAFAVQDFLEASLAGRQPSAVALFPQYRNLQALAGVVQVHPADLWEHAAPSELVDLRLSGGDSASYDATGRRALDQAVLHLVRGQVQEGGQGLFNLAMALAAGESREQAKAYWQLVAGFARGVVAERIALDVYAKKALPGIVAQYVSLSDPDLQTTPRGVRELLFHCVMAKEEGAQAPVLDAVRTAYGFADFKSVDYNKSTFGNFDPAILIQGRKRLFQAKELWATYTGGDVDKVKAVSDQLGLLADSIEKLMPNSQALVKAMRAVVQKHVPREGLPAPELALEMATIILYLEAIFQDFDPMDAGLTERTDELAARLTEVMTGKKSRPLAPWMEELYHRFSERSTLGSVVGELRGSFAEIEKSLDVYFRTPTEAMPLADVSSRLGQMRGVFMVLGLEHGAQATVQIRDWVEQLLSQELSVESAQLAGGVFDKIGNSLGALGFLVDMLGYQPQLAKQLFAFDAEKGELLPVMGRAPQPARKDRAGQPAMLAAVVEPQQEPAPAVAPSQPETSQSLADDDWDEDDLLGIFLEEAKEVLTNARASLEHLATHPTDSEDRTALRRAFHTLKGSSRMVGLAELGEGAWAMEQAHNTSLAESHECAPELQALSAQAIEAFGQWVAQIAGGNAQAVTFTAAPFKASADAWRQDHRLVPIESAPVQVAQTPQAVADEVIELTLPTAEPDFDFSVPPSETVDPAVLTALEFEDTQLPTIESVEPAPSVVEAVVEPEALVLPEEPQEPPLPELVVLAEPLVEVATAVPQMEPEPEPQDENIKVIGNLRINLALYNVYLSEADEWSRWLQAEISELQLQADRLPSQDSVAWAHSLAGSSATVGLQALSSLAREMEAALIHATEHPVLLVEPARVLLAQASDEIRRVLHQFAAGFETPVDTSLSRRLSAFARTFVETPPVAAPAATHVRPELAQVTPSATLSAVRTIQLDDDDIDAQDMVDPDLFPIFEEEALELLPNLGAALRQWHSRVDNRSARQEALRLMHTIKGSARLAGALKLGELVHRMESQTEHLGEGTRAVDIEPLIHEFDKVSGLFDALRKRDEQAYQAALDQSGPASAPEVAANVSVATQVAESTAPAVPPTSAPAPLVTLPVALQGVVAPAGLVVRQSTQTVRVKAGLLDRLVNQAGEVMMSRSRLESEVDSLRGSLTDLTGNLDKLRLQLRDIELQAESQMQSRMAQAKEAQANFDPLEFDRFTRVQELTRMMAESVNDVATVQRNLQRTLQSAEDDLVAQARLTRELQRDLLRTRMVEFESISERLYRVVRLASKESGKQVRLDITGGKIEMDRGVLDRVAPAFEHILRNCVAHGIEDELTRARAGKDGTGTISIALTHEGNDVTVAFADDGAGLNIERIRDKALSLGLVKSADEVTDARAGELIFAAGFSTASEVSELAGRGIGMDVVRSEVLSLGGRVETGFQRGLGTQFKLILPLTTAVTQVVMIRAGELSVGVPSTMVEIVRRSTQGELEKAYKTGQFDAGQGETVPFYWSGSLLQSSARSSEPVGRTTPVMIFRSAAQRVAMHVDEVLGNQEVVVKNLGPQLSRLPGLAGMTILPSGTSVLIYNPVALATVYGQQSREWTTRLLEASASKVQELARQAALSSQPAAMPLVLVVDDSITVRKVTQRLLQREGYRVSLAADGLQALEKLQEEIPTIVLSDIEMPRMDGFDLARNIRNDERLKHLPIVMITSRIAEKHREHAANLGVNHYLGKPYSEEELLALVKRYSVESVEA